MRGHSMKTTGRLVLLAAAMTLVAVAGCSKHKDFPAELPLITPPTPTNLSITDDGNGRYTLTWDIGDPAAVDHYNLYLVSAFGTEFEDETPDTNIGVDLGTGIAIPGVVLGISAVTVENVEGAMVTVVTP